MNIITDGKNGTTNIKTVSSQKERNVMIDNKVITVTNYATNALQEKLSLLAKNGYKLVSTEMANSEHNVIVMYLFFVKES